MIRYLNYILLLVVVGVWLSVFFIDNNLRIIACDVGQGDAILVTYKNVQILTDGGPNNKVVECLGKYMPVYDRTVELVILTHPQADHYTGLIEVLRRYKVDNYLSNSQGSSNQGYQVLEKEVGSSGAHVVNPVKGMIIRVGLIQIDILAPEGNSQMNNVNNIGIVTLLKYGQFKALFTADVENEVSDLLATYPEVQGIDYIKVNHHGSRNGLTQKLLEKIVPSGGLPQSNAKQLVGVISLGKNNRYGHPHEEVIKMLSEKDIKILRTDEMGDVVVTYPYK